MRVIVDKERCVAAGSCVITSPAVFDQDEEDGKVVLLIETPDDRLREEVLESVNVCPVAALSIAD
ncbi:ferredoxin [Streptomyces sp. NBC_01260]|uniref:Ferredoxin n=1 Tax=Streptomyces laculatispora TaxID=887464 RepID=A0ABY9I153_9ACTN|nr:MULTISPECIES: ferredoxin [Streptomyces]MCX4769695.1 ferredoxin [Streptomyces sp. NBC_01285]ROQ82941.1 ferredoxin [Streptomyces sp. CEV 2-1]RPK43216.1 Ferredoxin-2 [Streptomyces sp. ADI92-24]WLQ40551.1 ferredoxin [Streptomyces laculatispora]